MKSRKRRWIFGLLLLFLVLAGFQLITYLAYGERLKPAAALRQYAHANGRNWDFAAVERDSWAAMTFDQQTALEAVLHQSAATIYHDEDAVPLGQLITHPLTADERASFEKLKVRPDLSPQVQAYYARTLQVGYEVAGYTNGIRFRWRPAGSGLFWTRCDSGYWMGNLGAAYGKDLYVWVLGFWVRVRDYGHVVS
jgi:hypothetical protein